MHNKNTHGFTAARERGNHGTALPSRRGNPTTSPLTAAVLAVLYPGALTLAQEASPEAEQAIEPSWPPQTAAMRNGSGSALLELDAT